MNVQTIVFFQQKFQKIQEIFLILWNCTYIHYKDTDMLIQVHVHLHVDQPKWKRYTLLDFSFCWENEMFVIPRSVRY